jgi:hypothetical protein
MLESKMDQQKCEASTVGDAHTEDWFAARDWVAAGERFRARPDSASQRTQGSVQNRPCGVTSKPAIGGLEL